MGLGPMTRLTRDEKQLMPTYHIKSKSGGGGGGGEGAGILLDERIREPVYECRGVFSKASFKAARLDL